MPGKATKGTTGTAGNTRRALFIAADGYEDSELLVPLYRLREEGLATTIAAPKAGTITGKHGYTVEAPMGMGDVRPEEYDVLVIPGGRGPETVRLHPAAATIARHFIESGKPVAAICHGPQILITADVLKGRRATCWKGVRDDLKMAGAAYEDSEVVVDRNLITSRHPGDLPAFSRELIKQVRG